MGIGSGMGKRYHSVGSRNHSVRLLTSYGHEHAAGDSLISLWHGHGHHIDPWHQQEPIHSGIGKYMDSGTGISIGVDS